MKKASKKSKKQKTTKVISPKENYPAGHRSILWRPQRLKYLLQKHVGKDCVFCAAARIGKSVDSLVLWSSPDVMILMNKYPYNNGHLLVLPQKHVSDLNDLDQPEFQKLHESLQIAINALRKAANKAPDGFNIGLNLGSAAGAGLPGHLHYHVIPRWVGDSNFFPIVGQTKVISETLEQTYERLLPCF